MIKIFIYAITLINLVLQTTSHINFQIKSISPRSTGGEIVEPNSPVLPPPNNVEGTYDTFEDVFDMKSYFENLDANFARNYFGTCSYTALIMLLSYYDSFYNPIFIPDEYSSEPSIVTFSENEWHLNTSPGVVYSTSSLGYKGDPETEDDDDMPGYVDETYSYLFDSKLIRMSDYVSSLAAIQYQPLLDLLYGSNKVNFISDYIHPTDTDVPIHIFENTVIGLLEEGIPVILNICNNVPEEQSELGEYHAVVAYAYENGQILCHFGWGQSTIGIPFNDPNDVYTEIYSYAYLDLDTCYYNHTHTKRYIYNNLSYCGCGYHSHKFVAQPFSNTYHKLECDCGEIRYEEHINSLFCGVCCNGSIMPGGPILG